MLYRPSFICETIAFPSAFLRVGTSCLGPCPDLVPDCILKDFMETDRALKMVPSGLALNWVQVQQKHPAFKCPHVPCEYFFSNE